MPYYTFDQETLEPRVVRTDLFPYVEVLTTTRGRWNSQGRNHQPAPKPTTQQKPSASYPVAVRPNVHSKRKQKMLYCKSLARALDRFRESPSVYDESLRKPLPPLLSLPAELRQNILDLVLEDNEVLFKRPNSTTQTLAVVCKTFAMDIPQVNKLWNIREDALRAEMGFDRTGMSAYMDDLLAPLHNASKVYGDLQQARAVKDARLNKRRDRHSRAKKNRRN